MTVRFPGRPEELFAAAGRLDRQAERLRQQSRAASAAGALATRCWTGGASVAHAHRSGEHVRATSAAAVSLEAGSRQVRRFAAEMTRIQGAGAACVSRRRGYEIELRRVLHEAPVTTAAFGGAGGAAIVADEIAVLRRRIAYEDGVLHGLTSDMVRLKTRFGDALLALVPPEIYPWWVTARSLSTGYDAAEAMVRPGAATVRLLTAIRTHQAARATGDAARAAKALRAIVAARKELSAPGPIAKTQQRVRRAAATTAGQRVLASATVRRVTDSRSVMTVRASPVTRVATKVLGPVGMADTMYAGAQDMATGGGHDGARGVATRALGAGAMVGAPLLLVSSATPVGAVLVGGWLVFKGAGALYDNRDSIKSGVRSVGRALFGRRSAPPQASTAVTDRLRHVRRGTAPPHQLSSRAVAAQARRTDLAMAAP